MIDVGARSQGTEFAGIVLCYDLDVTCAIDGSRMYYGSHVHSRLSN